MNIVLVVFDSLRKDCMGCYGPAPWWPAKTPSLDRLARESMRFDRVYPESLPTLPARRALYTGRRVYPFADGAAHHKGDFVGAPGWGPIPEHQETVAELLRDAGYRTALIADVYHMFKPSKNFWRGFDQWMFLRGQETDPYRSGPAPSKAEIDHWLPRRLQTPARIAFIRQCILNMRDRMREEDYFCPRVMIEASRWLEQNSDAGSFFLVVESFDPHEPWFVPPHYRRMFDPGDGPEQVISTYSEPPWTVSDAGDREEVFRMLHRTRANYSGLVTMCDRWLGHLYESMRVLGLLENTVLIVTADHGHSIGDHGYMGKRGYPSTSEVHDVPLLIRHPQGTAAGRRSGHLLQHTDLAAQILAFTGVPPRQPLDGVPFWEAAVDGQPGIRDHVTIGWGSAMTVVNSDWWMNCKVNGAGVFLRRIIDGRPADANEAAAHPEICHELFDRGALDAGGPFPDYLIRLAQSEADAPGCSELAVRR